MIMQGGFNANQYEPNQGGQGGHPPAQKIPFTITDTKIVENKDKNGGMFVVDLTSSMGTMVQRYNIWNQSPKAVEIAHGQLSALCRATGRYQIDWSNEGAALKGGQGLMDIGYQKGEEPDPAFPDRKGYTELKKVYDMAGNEPGKSGNANTATPMGGVQNAGQQGGFAQGQPQANGASPSNGQGAPMTNQGNGNWGNQPQPNQTNQLNQQPQQGQQNGNGGAWQPGGNAGQPSSNPPWGSRQ